MPQNNQEQPMVKDTADPSSRLCMSLDRVVPRDAFTPSVKVHLICCTPPEYQSQPIPVAIKQREKKVAEDNHCP
jgi:hypothetical protein